MGGFLRATALGLASVMILGSSVAQAQDSDADGAPDATDAAPCDATTSAFAYAPAQGVFGSLVFEDLWPLLTYRDLDFNDLHVAYNYEYRVAADGGVTSLRIVLHVLNIGAEDHHGFGIGLPVPRAQLASATRTVGGVTTDLSPSLADANVVLVVSSDFRELFGDRSGPINSVNAEPVYTSQPIVLDIAFNTSTNLSAAEAPHDPFIFDVSQPGRETHRPDQSGTASMDTTLFGTGRDGSGGGRNFVDHSGLPYALDFPQVVAVPSEGTDIHALYPDIATFAASGGAQATDFYLTNVDSAAQYSPAGGAPTPTFVAPAVEDTSCVPVGGPSCLAILQSGRSTGDGIYPIDVDGTGPAAEVDFYCDMTTDGGGWTLVEHVRSGYHKTASAVNAGSVMNRDTHAKHSDADIKTLARAGQREAMIVASSTTYILRYSDGEWSSFNSVGWTNVMYDAKQANGTWVNNTCNGHYNNRGFSTYADNRGRACPYTYAGGARYITTWHTYNYSGGVGGIFDVFVR